MSKFLSLCLIAFILLFSACSSHKIDHPSNLKSFEDEDRLAMFALYAKSRGDVNSTVSLFQLLYEKSEKIEYRNEELISLVRSAQYERALKRIALYEDKNKIDAVLERYKIAVLIELKRYEEAKHLALKLMEITKSEKEYQQVATIYMIQGRYEFALRYFQSAYNINYNEKILDKMAVILYVNLNRKAEAVSYLETHMRLHGCSETTCLRLASFYSEKNNVDGMLRIYLKLYENTKAEKYSLTIIKLYHYKKDMISLIRFLEKSGSDDALLLQMYINTKNYPRVVSLGSKLYEREGDPYFLGQSAIFEYEGAKDKKSPEMIDSVMRKLKSVVEVSDEAVYLNYLGYLLIDHEIDVEGGMEYVKKALEVQKESPFYLDSLAWGYYKQGKCEKALILMKTVQKNLGKDDSEVTSHVKAIKQCIKEGRR